MKNFTLSALMVAATIAAPLAAQATNTSAVYSADGSITFSVKLPTGQQYVEVFAKNNGVQNISQNIAGSSVFNADGTTTFSYKAHGYKPGDIVEYRFYSYLPYSPGVFSPGPVENTWNTLVVENTLAIPVLKDASLIMNSYAFGYVQGQNFGAATTLDVASYHEDSQALLGFGLGAVPPGMVITKARLVVHASSPTGASGEANLSLVNNSASWSEAAVNRTNAPAATLVGTCTLPARGEGSVDVTALVSDAVRTGKSEISFLLSSKGQNFFINSKENPAGNGPVLELSLSAAPVLTGWIDTKWYVANQVLRSCFLNLNWTAPAGFEGTVDHYELYTTTNGGATWDFWTNAAGNSLIYSWTPSQHVTASIVAVGANGARSARSTALVL